MRLNWPDFLEVVENETGGAFELSAACRSLLLSLLTSADAIFRDLSVGEKDQAAALIALAQRQLMHEVIPTSAGFSMIPVGAFIPFAGHTPPSNFLFCEGQVLSPDEYPELWDAIHDNYKIVIEEVGLIALPDMRERVVAGASLSYPVGWQHGEGAHTLTLAEMPSHQHHRNQAGKSESYIRLATGNGTIASTPSNGRVVITETHTGLSGGGEAHNNWQPTHHAPYIICVRPEVNDE